MKIGVCIRAKDEQNTITDWVSHYLRLDFDRIIIYDNMSEPPISETIKTIINDKVIIKIDEFVGSNQPVIYQKAIDENKDLDWLLLCDADEFLWLKSRNKSTIKDFLSNFSPDTGTILINWLTYGAGGKKTYDTNKCVFDQFTIREEYSHFWNTFVKSFIRPKLINKFGNVHVTVNTQYKCRNVYGEILNLPNNIEERCDCPDPNFSDETPVVLVHFMTLDIESMLSKRQKNGRHDLGFTLDEADTKYSLEWYKKDGNRCGWTGGGFKDNVKDIRMTHKTIYFITNSGETHLSIINKGDGASESTFYLTAKKLSEYFNIVIFNREKSQIIDNIEYRYLPDNKDIGKIENSIIIVQRHFDIIIDLHKINPNNQFILWSHDFLVDNFSHLSGKYSPKYINNYFNQNKISIISVSNFHKKNINIVLPNVLVFSIYNALFPEYLIKNENIEYNRNNIIFCSNWAKGLGRVLRISIEYYKHNPNFKLILIKPKYCDYEPNVSKFPFVEIRGCIENRVEYCELLQSCLAVIATSFPETFGCVFSEALHLGVPVIGDRSILAGYHEFVPRELMCNFNNPREVINLIWKIGNYRPNVILDKQFYNYNIIKEWIKILNIISPY